MKNKILSIIIIIALSTILGLAYNASTNLSLRLLEATDDVRPFREDFNYNFELVDDIFDDVSLIEFSYLDGVTSAIQDQIDAVGSGAVDTSGTPVDNDIAVFTDANTIEGLSYAELKAVLNLEIGTDILAQQSIGIIDNYLLEVDGSPNDDEYARFTANGLEGRTEAEFKGDFNLEIGTDVQAYDAGLLSIAGLTTAANKSIYTTALDTYGVYTLSSAGRALIDDADASAQRTTLGLVIGTNVQAFDASLTSIAGLTYASASFIKLTANDTYAVRTLSEVRTDLGLVIGTNVMAWDAQLDDIAALAYTDGNFIVGDGSNWVAESGATARTSLGIDLSLYYLKTEIDDFSELQTIISDKTLINEEDAVIFDETVSMVKELDITGALAFIDINPAGQTTKNIVDITPTATLNATQVWCGYNINGAALDPNGVDSELIGFNLDFSGVSESNSPIMHGYRSKVPFGQDAFHIREGQLHIDTVLPSTAASEFTTIDIVIDSSAMVSTSEYHAMDVATTGIPSGEVVAIGTHTEVEVIHQHIATFATPSQTEFAGVKHTGGNTWADGIDAYGVIFVDNSDAIYVGSATQFDEIEVIMTTGGTKSIKPTFWYSIAGPAWTEFHPADDTDGFQQSGEVRWEVAAITATWTDDGDPGGADTTAGYWIKIVRTRVGAVGSPDPTTVKIGLVTEFVWDKDGNVVIESLVVSGSAGITGTKNYYSALGSDHTYSANADLDSQPVGESVVFGDFLYFDWADVEWKKAKADAIGTTPALRIALESKSNGQTCMMLVKGYIRDDSAFDFGASRVFLNDDTAGTADDTAPAEAGDQIQIVGIGITADILYFDPSVDVGEI